MVKEACSNELASPCTATELVDKGRASPGPVQCWRTFKIQPSCETRQEAKDRGSGSCIIQLDLHPSVLMHMQGRGQKDGCIMSALKAL